MPIKHKNMDNFNITSFSTVPDVVDDVMLFVGLMSIYASCSGDLKFEERMVDLIEDAKNNAIISVTDYILSKPCDYDFSREYDFMCAMRWLSVTCLSDTGGMDDFVLDSSRGYVLRLRNSVEIQNYRIINRACNECVMKKMPRQPGNPVNSHQHNTWRKSFVTDNIGIILSIFGFPKNTPISFNFDMITYSDTLLSVPGPIIMRSGLNILR